MVECVRATITTNKGGPMTVYKFVELVGTSNESWEDAAASAVQAAGKALKDIRVAEVTDMDLQVTGESITYRTKLKVSYKYDGEL